MACNFNIISEQIHVFKRNGSEVHSENMTRQRIERKTVFLFQSPRSLCNCSWSNRLFVLFGYRPSYRSVIIHLVQTVPTWPVLMNNLWLRRGKVSNSVNSEHPFTPLLWYHFPFTPFPGSYYRSLEGGPDGIYPHHHLLREPTYFMVKLIIRGGGGILAYSVLMACRLQDGKKKLHATVWRPHKKIPRVLVFQLQRISGKSPNVA